MAQYSYSTNEYVPNNFDHSHDYFSWVAENVFLAFGTPYSAHSARSQNQNPNNIRENQVEPLPVKREKSVLNQQLDNPDVEQADQKIEKKLAQKSNFKVNPFYNEIFQTFLSEPKKGINFSEFVEIMNVFSSQIDVDCKASWIFEVLAKIDDKNQVSNNQNQNDDSQESNLSNGYTQKLSRDQLKTYIIRISEEGDSEEELGENPIDQEEIDEDMTYSQIIERTLDELIEEAINVDMHLTDEKKEVQRNEKFLTKYQFVKLVKGHAERFVKSWSFGNVV